MFVMKICFILNCIVNCFLNSSRSQRSSASSGGQWRQYNKEQWQNKSKAHATGVSQSQRGAGSSGQQWRQRRNESKAPVTEVDKEEQGPAQQAKETVPKGICQTMCPSRELWNRETQNRLHCFEMVLGTEKDRRPRGDPLRAVKEYSRPAAGKDATNPADLRPPAVLFKTVCYLIDDIAASPNLQPWTEASHIYIIYISHFIVKL